MASVTVFNAARMLAIEAASIISGAVDGSGNLILTKHDASTVNAGHVVGPQGPVGPTGAVVAFAGASVPAGWLLCDGSSLLRTSYPDLFAAIGTLYGAADGTHFNLPNIKGRGLVGHDPAQTEFDTIGETGGAKTHTHSTPSHSHSTPAHTHTTQPHSHSVPVHSHTTPTHTHSTPAHSHPLSDAGGAKISLDSTNAWIKEALVGGFASWAATVRTNVNAAISIISSTVTGTTAAGLTGNTDNSTAGTTGTAAPTTNNSAADTTGTDATTTDLSAAGTSGTSSGTTGSTSNLDPYIAMPHIIKT